ncbi:MAG: hypothetical protein PHT30_01680 [Bacilli bacterium]|nr:hypothetical protein [Bacilli bacterium]
MGADNTYGETHFNPDKANKGIKRETNSSPLHFNEEKDNAVSPLISSISSMNEVMKEFLSGIDEELEKDPHNKIMQGAKWAYSIAISQFYNRFNRYCR